VHSTSLDDLTRRNVETIAAIQRAFEGERTRGEKVVDLLAAVVGSWAFIIAQTVVLAAWVALNVMALLGRWDPYPFILLNLVLSFQAAYATPIIMMSQNRQARLDARRNQLDLQINLLAEQESTETLRLLRLLCERFGIRTDGAGAARALAQPTDAAELVRLIRNILEEEHPAPAPDSTAPGGAAPAGKAAG